MSLAEYKKRRDFKKTAEPPGKVTKRSSKNLTYVIQKHAATRLHYDLRLELDGVLKSWAVPKGPSFDPAEKRLAVEVEDHPLDYAKFEGRIPEGEYGAGEVIVWDRGTWTPEGDPHEGLRRGDLKFSLQGEKLQGRWVLVRLRNRSERRSDKPNWLLIKHHDEYDRPLEEYDVTAEQPQSVKTGRTLEDLQVKANRRSTVKKQAQKTVARRAATAKKAAPKKAAPKKAAAEKAAKNGQSRSRRKRTAKKRPPPAGAKKSSMPANIDIELATLEAEVPRGDHWLHEIKFDGYRIIARLTSGKVKLITRRHQDWTHRYKAIAQAVQALPAESAILDGELVALLPSGVSSFQALQNAGKAGSDAKLVYYVFDLLYLDGYDLRRLPLLERKDLLQSLLAEANSPLVQYSDHISGDGAAFLRESCQLGLEGIISKRADRPYVAGRSGDWVKVKCLGREELVIGGFTLSTADRRGIGSLIVGYFDEDKFDEDKLIYAGRVGTGFSHKTAHDLWTRLQPLRLTKSPFANPLDRLQARLVQWVRPDLVVQIHYLDWTGDGLLRHASFKAVREDKRARAVANPRTMAR